MPKFTALRIWSGCSSLFFTLNPHDIRSPITVLLLQDDQRLEKRFSLDMTDSEAEQYMKDFLQENPRRLHELVVANPLAATRCFHWTVRLVIRTLFNCEDQAGIAPDGIPAHEEAGVFGHVRAYFGVVEPQMRKALHIHMVIQLLGFSHPQDLFGIDILPNLFRRIWNFVASICFRSTEAFAAYLNADSAMDTLAKLPLLPLTNKQRGMIGEERARKSMEAQKRARGIADAPEYQPLSRPSVQFTSQSYGNGDISKDAWVTHAMK